jgi:hypothetical protein
VEWQLNNDAPEPYQGSLCESHMTGEDTDFATIASDALAPDAVPIATASGGRVVAFAAPAGGRSTTGEPLGGLRIAIGLPADTLLNQELTIETLSIIDAAIQAGRSVIP